jgi:hypothetical protein
VSRTHFLQAAIVISATAVALGVSEAALRGFDLYAPIAQPVQPAQPDLYQPSPVFGYHLKPSLVTTYRYPRTSDVLMPLVSNSDGFRSSREFSDDDPRLRVVVIGDSFVFGLGVRAEHRLTERLETLEPGWRVDNLGMPGWGLDLMIRALEHIGPKADPDIVVLAVYTDDFRRVLPHYAGLGYAYPKFELVRDELQTVPFRYPRAWERLRIVQAMSKLAWRRDANHYALNEALLDRFLANARVMQFRPLVAFLPGRTDTPVDQERRAFLHRWSVARGMPYLDLTDAIHGHGVENVYLRDNWHWNAAGHQVAAEEVRKALLSMRNGVARR